MLRRSGTFLVLLASALSLTGFSSSPAVMAEESGNPWWVWIVIFFALVAFVALLIRWWMRGFDEEEEEESLPAARVAPLPSAIPPAVEILETEADQPVAQPPSPEAIVPEPELVAPAPPPEPKADDLTRIEGIGPKISSVLKAAGITTFAQLAAAEPAQLLQVLEEADPRLLRLADPRTWPEQAELAAAGNWQALETLQEGLKGGRRA